MASSDSNARRFLDAFANIENILKRQQRHEWDDSQYVAFGDLLDKSRTVHHAHKKELRAYAILRNSIAHNRYLNGQPIAEPREDIVNSILKIERHLEHPLSVIEATSNFDIPQIFSPDDDLGEFLSLVKEKDFSQAPVKMSEGLSLITTNAIARWFAASMETDGGIVDSTPIREILNFAETGDRLKTVRQPCSTVEAIRILSGTAGEKEEPPAALLVLGKANQPPQRLVTRSDLALLYSELEV